MITLRNFCELSFPMTDEGERQAIQAEITLKTMYRNVVCYPSTVHMVVALFTEGRISEDQRQLLASFGAIASKINVDCTAWSHTLEGAS